MPVVPFTPKYMKIGVLTAALQELTPRAVRDPDPDRAVEDWAAFAREVGADYMQLSAALHPSESDVPAEAMLDPVANTLDLRQPFNKDRAKRVQRALEANKIGLSDIGYFDNMLHDDPKIRRKKHDFMRRVFETASLLGVDAVCGFVGRNQALAMDQNLKDAGYPFLIGGFHVKGQVIDAKGVSAWGYGGQTMERGDWKDGKPSPNPADQANAWKKQVVLCEHELPGTAKHDPLAYLQNRTVDWLDHQLAARELLSLDVANTHLVVEHEYPKARIQDRGRLSPILKGSIAFTRQIDEAAACMFALQHEVLAAQGIPIQGHGRQAYRS